MSGTIQDAFLAVKTVALAVRSTLGGIDCDNVWNLPAGGGTLCRFRKTGAPVAKAAARHILVASEQECLDLKSQIEGGTDFADLAKQHSQCPSGKQGGALGEFAPGQMVPEFDRVVFQEEVGKVHGPVKTQFGYHLVEITSRED